MMDYRAARKEQQQLVMIILDVLELLLVDYSWSNELARGRSTARDSLPRSSSTRRTCRLGGRSRRKL